MKIEQIYTGCLAQGAYYIESEGEAAVIDPLREIEPYLQRAEKSGAKIKYVLETHFHADFVSGHLDLAEASGAKIVFGPNASPSFAAHIARDAEELKVGKLTFQVLHTPGHTMESTCYLLKDENGKDHAIFTGDTLFIGDVGRPDLAQKSDLSQEDLAGYLFDSLRNKIMPLADEVIVYPAHGAGSACGKNMSKETSDTLGHQKQVNYALRADMSKAEFTKEVITGLMPPPSYFPLNVKMNKEGYDNINEVLARGTQALSPEAFDAAANETGALILDTRAPQVFAQGFIPNAINIGIDGSFAPWVGTLITDIKQPILLVTELGREQEVVTRLARVGYDYAIGYLDGGFEAWQNAGKEIDTIESIDADELANRQAQNPDLRILDVRKISEFDSEHVINAENVALDYINQTMAMVKKDQTYHVHCAGGYRSMIFISILKARGYENLIDIKGGFGAMKASQKFQITDYVCPSTML
ncbi:MAG: MBL fold metallo-hydrolase [Microscillaceae bacterium]|jgi:glyoxylase-like metal-dependent hydrolase (beta-lactamase superfamily II)/rhodanese-related sulfurtransferase|nr:MBL fold metallo-hydrolase [Microscillaceae bacterium]